MVSIGTYNLKEAFKELCLKGDIKLKVKTSRFGDYKNDIISVSLLVDDEVVLDDWDYMDTGE